jgi:hypothetical protein
MPITLSGIVAENLVRAYRSAHFTKISSFAFFRIVVRLEFEFVWDRIFDEFGAFLGVLKIPEVWNAFGFRGAACS